MPSRPSMQEADARQQSCCQNHFSNQCSVYYHFVNLGGGIIYFLIRLEMSRLVHWPCRKRPTKGPLRQWSQQAPHRVGVPGLACALLRGRGEVGGISGQPPPVHDSVWPFLGNRGDIPTQLPHRGNLEPSFKPTRRPWV